MNHLYSLLILSLDLSNRYISGYMPFFHSFDKFFVYFYLFLFLQGNRIMFPFPVSLLQKKGRSFVIEASNVYDLIRKKAPPFTWGQKPERDQWLAILRGYHIVIDLTTGGRQRLLLLPRRWREEKKAAKQTASASAAFGQAMFHLRTTIFHAANFHLVVWKACQSLPKILVKRGGR